MVREKVGTSMVLGESAVLTKDKRGGKEGDTP